MAERLPQTEQMWPDETPEEMVERVRKEQGDAIAAVVARSLNLPVKRKRRIPERVGNRERVPPAPSGVRPQSPSWRERPRDDRL